MELVTVRDLRIRPGDVWRRLRDHHDVVITSNGRPIAVMVEVAEGSDIDDTLAALRRIRAQSAVSRMRRTAAAKGLDQLTSDDVDAEIAATRRERGVNRRSKPST